MAERDSICDLPFDAMIDRVVEGGLTPAELREAVTRLEAEPEGWRRCALGFLEAQSWGEAFRSLGEAQDGTESESAGRTILAFDRAASPRPWARPAQVRTLAAAAAVLVAFSLGWLAHGWKAPPGEGARETGMIADHRERRPIETIATVGMQPERRRQSDADPADDQGLPRVREVARLRIGSDESTAAEVPILDGPGVGQGWLAEAPLPVSEYDRAIWRQRGYDVAQRRQLVAVPLADGRRAAIPVDQVEVRYVGREPL